MLAILNSRVIQFYLNLIAETSGMGTNRWINNYVKDFPIPTVTPKLQIPIIQLVNEILHQKTADPAADTTAEEAEIDRLVYALYGLTPAEVAAVEGR